MNMSSRKKLKVLKDVIIAFSDIIMYGLNFNPMDEWVTKYVLTIYLWGIY